MKRTIALTVATLMMLGVLAGPAAAENKGYVVVRGAARVVKTDSFGPSCQPGQGAGGLGLPILTGVKKGYWRVVLELVNVTTMGPATLTACGKLNPSARRGTGGIGAACGMSKGYDGDGFINDPSKGQEIFLERIGWKFTEAGTILATGHAEWLVKDAEKGSGKMIAELNAQGAGPCADKSIQPGTHKKQDKDGGAEFFTVNGTVEVLQGMAGREILKWNDLPGSPKGAEDNPAFCKHEDPVRCPVYGPKKEPEED